MEDMIILAEKSRENEELLVIENVNKTLMAEVVKVSSAIDLHRKCTWIINNSDMDIAKDLGLTGIKKYWRCTSQI